MAIEVDGAMKQQSLLVFEQMTILMLGIFLYVLSSLLGNVSHRDTGMLNFGSAHRWYLTLSFPYGEGRLLLRKARLSLVHVSVGFAICDRGLTNLGQVPYFGGRYSQVLALALL